MSEPECSPTNQKERDTEPTFAAPCLPTITTTMSITSSSGVDLADVFASQKTIDNLSHIYPNAGFVYIVSSPIWSMVLKYGLTNDFRQRLRYYNGSHPQDHVNVRYIVRCLDIKVLEDHIKLHVGGKFAVSATRLEWVSMREQELISIVESFLVKDNALSSECKFPIFKMRTHDCKECIVASAAVGVGTTTANTMFASAGGNAYANFVSCFKKKYVAEHLPLLVAPSLLLQQTQQQQHQQETSLTPSLEVVAATNESCAYACASTGSSSSRLLTARLRVSTDANTTSEFAFLPVNGTPVVVTPVVGYNDALVLPDNDKVMGGGDVVEETETETSTAENTLPDEATALPVTTVVASMYSDWNQCQQSSAKPSNVFYDHTKQSWVVDAGKSKNRQKHFSHKRFGHRAKQFALDWNTCLFAKLGYNGQPASKKRRTPTAQQQPNDDNEDIEMSPADA